MRYHPEDIEKKWQQYWASEKTFRAGNTSEKPPFYVLDMFPYPSGAGLHVGHPLGYIASDVFARYKRLKGFNVLHPMGYDSFGLPAEQYAIQTGQHPAITTSANIDTYRRQMDSIGFSFDWDREVRTSDPAYYKWTQWIFLQLFDAWYCKNADAARPISRLVKEFEQHGNKDVNAHCDETPLFSADEWNSWDEAQQQTMLLNYRIAYLSEAYVNWCPALGTVLANDEVKDGVSERGGHPVEQKLMKQWSMRITAYSQRLLDGLETIEWSDSLKEMQRNWIGRSEGASILFNVICETNHPDPSKLGSPLLSEGGEQLSDSTLAEKFEQRTSSPPGKGEYSDKSRREGVIEVFTTRPDTIFGVTFMTLAPEHALVEVITTSEQKDEVEAYIEKAKSRSDRERMADVKSISGVFTGAYAEHPFTGEPIPIWIGDYVLAGYGTGAVMAVPSGDQRDWNFATHFNIPIIPVIGGSNVEAGANEDKDGVLINSGFLNGLKVTDAISLAIQRLEEKGIGKGRINYRQRDAVFGRQRYWGEPIPIYYKDGVPYPVKEEHLPIELPEIDEYLPTETGEPPLARAKGWGYDPERGAVQTDHPDPSGHPSCTGGERLSDSALLPKPEQRTSSPPGKGECPDFYRDEGVFPFERSTMPGWAGSSWYYLRYMDPHNDEEFVSKKALEYWQNVDFYLGGSEHATGHLLYVRFWTKFLYDLGYLPFDEPAKKLVNQGMIQGVSEKIWRWRRTDQTSFPPKPEERPFTDRIRIFIGGDEKSFNPPKPTSNIFISSDIRKEYNTKKRADGGTEFIAWTGSQNVDVSLLMEPRLAFDQMCELDLERFLSWNKQDPDSLFICKGGFVQNLKCYNFKSEDPTEPTEQLEFYTTPEVEKMSKSKYNVVNPDDVISKYGADTLRLYEMFLGPLEDAKPWNTNGIEGVSRFLKKFWGLFHDDEGFAISEDEPTAKELKALHATIKKVEEDIERLSLNTCVSQFMICVNELSELKCNKRAILEPLTIVLSTFAPHICEELWEKLGYTSSISLAEYPTFDEKYLVEDSISYPISFNGKTRLNLELPASMGKDEIETFVLANADVRQRLDGATPKKVIVVPKRIVNIVV